MSIQNWPSTMKTRVGQRSINVIQIILIVSLGSIVLLRDSLGVGIEFSLNTGSPVEADAIESAGVNYLAGPKRNIASQVEEKDKRELESVPDSTDPSDFSYEQPPARKPRKHRRQVVDEDLETEGDPTTNVQELKQGVKEILRQPKKPKKGQVEIDEFRIEEDPTASVREVEQAVDNNHNYGEEPVPFTEFDKAREKRGRHRRKDARKDLMSKEDPTIEVKEVEEMFLTSDKLPREFTIPEDLRDLQSKEAIKEEKVKRNNKKHQPKKDGGPPDKLAFDSNGEQTEEEAIEEVVEKQEESLTDTEPIRGRPLPEPPVFTGEPLSLGITPENWDEQRIDWLQKYPWLKTTPRGKPRMLMITGSSPWACKNPTGDHVQLKSLKNKIDYARQHEIELFYNIAHLERNLTSYWAKLPIIRKLMLTHPEVEWFFWVDADAMFTDMLFEIPMERYDDYNIVMWGWEENLYKNRSWVAINDGAFFFRNCQWSLDLLDMWAPMGPAGDVRVKWGEFFSEYMAERPSDFPADDQSALVYLILTKPELQTKIKLEWDYELSGYWKLFVDKFEEFMTTPGNHPGLGGKTWPFIVHFTGCQPCTGHHNPTYSAEECAVQMERAYNFADNQVLQTMGFMHETLNSSHVKRIEEESNDYNVVESVGPNTWTTASDSYGV